MLDSDSLERLVPEELASGDTTGLATLDLHLERYAFAARHADRELLRAGPRRGGDPRARIHERFQSADGRLIHEHPRLPLTQDRGGARGLA